MNGNDFYSQTADWVVNTARRKPEALLLVAAGVALMMRSGSGFTSWSGSSSSSSRPGGVDGRASWQDETMTSGARAGVDRATDEASRYAGEVRNRVSETASAYASTVADYAHDARRRMGEYTGAVRENLSSATDQVTRTAQSAARGAADTLREQPLLIAALGLATGAAVAALFPATDIERRTLGPAGEALVGAAGAAGRDFMERATRTGEEVRRAAEEGLKDVVHQAADSFTRTESPGSTTPRSGTGV
jgi:ElaB/YqjD/DUF883 family membrane-anchored ribosome-binding protein